MIQIGVLCKDKKLQNFQLFFLVVENRHIYKYSYKNEKEYK